MSPSEGLAVKTQAKVDEVYLETEAEVIGSVSEPQCEITIKAGSNVKAVKAWLVVSVRPYNPEGISFIHHIKLLDDRRGWLINNKDYIFLDRPGNQYEFSYYHHGDVYYRLPSKEDKDSVTCKVGMATAACLYSIDRGSHEQVTIHIPLPKKHHPSVIWTWQEVLQNKPTLTIPDKHFQFLYETAVKSMALHSPQEVYPGPFIYRRFWFRDAAYILYSLLLAGLSGQALRVLQIYRTRQTAQGYFLSQEGEWDSNGSALWIMNQYCQITGSPPPAEWQKSVINGANWLLKKRLSPDLGVPHAGLLPSGFSAEHLGPNDFYFWDDFWAVAGLHAATNLCKQFDEIEHANRFQREAVSISNSIDRSLGIAAQRLERLAIPASVYRRLDAGAVGSLAASYPLALMPPDDPRMIDTVTFLMDQCMFKGGFFHDMTHSGINPYLSLQLAQVLLRQDDARFFDVVKTVAQLASPTGQWPEAIHPATLGGCMGDGQHIWACAEWALMMRNCFVREDDGRLILCSGIPEPWLLEEKPMKFGPAPTSFGEIEVSVSFDGGHPVVSWQGRWRRIPSIEIRLGPRREMITDGSITNVRMS